MILTASELPPSCSTSVETQIKTARHLPQPQRFLVDISNSPTSRRIQEACNEESTSFLEKLKLPTVILDTPSISHTMAAALSLSLLSHTLFLKSQVPFPISQLSRMPGGKSNSKAVKKRDELLVSFDTLASHLQTTFVAISTAYAKCKLVARDEGPGHTVAQASDVANPMRGTAHLMFVLGPSPNAARARIVLTIDGLDVKVWGARPPIGYNVDNEDGSTEEDSESEGSEDGLEEEDSEDESEEVDSEEDASDAEYYDSDAGSGPPPSRSPSPSPRSLAPSPESIPSPSISVSPLTTQINTTHLSPPAPLSPSALKPQVNPRPAPLATPQTSVNPRDAYPITSPASAPELTYAEEQQTLRAAERLLSRTLMNAWVDGEGDISSELAPTQTHLFLRAPRRFAHPAWAARQNMTRALDSVLDGFLEDAGAKPIPAAAKFKPRASKGVRTEGAWIGCRGGSAYAAARAQTSPFAEHGCAAGGAQDSSLQEGDLADEADEEIWWAWEGKIVGFADW